MAILGGVGGAVLPLVREMRQIPNAVLRPARIEIDQSYFLRRRHIRHGAPLIDEETQIGMLAAMDESAKRSRLIRVVEFAQDLRLIVLYICILQHELQKAARCFRAVAGAAPEFAPCAASLGGFICSLRLPLNFIKSAVREPENYRAKGFLDSLAAGNASQIVPFERDCGNQVKRAFAGEHTADHPAEHGR